RPRARSSSFGGRASAGTAPILCSSAAKRTGDSERASGAAPAACGRSPAGSRGRRNRTGPWLASPATRAALSHRTRMSWRRAAVSARAGGRCGGWGIEDGGGARELVLRGEGGVEGNVGRDALEREGLVAQREE